MRNPRTILLDCDGVMADFTTAYLRFLEQVSGRDVDRASITNWNYHECIASEEEDSQVWDLFETYPEAIAELGWEPGAEEGLIRLRGYKKTFGLRVCCLTAPRPEWTNERFWWLQQVAGFSRGDIVIAVDKALVRGAVLVDDRTKNLEEWLDANPKGVGILYDQPWNRADALPSRCRRAFGWREVVTLAIGL